MDLLSSGVGSGQQTVERLHVVLSENGFVVIQIVAVIGSHGIAVEHAVVACGVDRTGSVGGHDLVMVAGDFIQGVRLHKRDDLVIGEGEHVRGSGRVFQIAGLGIRLADHTVLKLPGVFGMLGGEGFAELFQKLLVGLRAPDLQVDQLALRFLSGGGGLILRGLLCRLLFARLRLRRLRAAGAEAGDQRNGKKQRQKLFHCKSSIIISFWVSPAS